MGFLFCDPCQMIRDVMLNCGSNINNGSTLKGGRTRDESQVTLGLRLAFELFTGDHWSNFSMNTYLRYISLIPSFHYLA